MRKRKRIEYAAIENEAYEEHVRSGKKSYSLDELWKNLELDDDEDI